MEAKLGSPGRGRECQASRLMSGWLKGLPQECSIKIPEAVCNVLEKAGQVGRRPRRHWPAKGLFQKKQKAL